MARTKSWKQTRSFSPTAVGTGETTPLFNVAAGVRVVSAAYQMLTNAAASSASTFTLGDETDPDGYIAVIDTETATMAAGAGAYLATSGGKLYAVDDTIDVVYAEGTPGATNPKVMFTVTFEQEFP